VFHSFILKPLQARLVSNRRG